MEWLEQIVQTYGYAALLIGTFLEGETILIIAGMFAAQGTLDVNLSILCAFIGSTAGDQLYFLIGRFKGQWLLQRKPLWRPRIERALAMVERHSTWLLLTYRFFYGVRNVTSFAVGLSKTSTIKFVCLNAIGAAVWALTFGYGGYLFGAALVRLVDKAKHYQRWILAGVIVLALVFWMVRLLRRRRKLAQQAQSAPLEAQQAPEPAGPQDL